MSRILVVAYSRSGNTRKVAQAIARACDADVEEIQDVRPRGGIMGWLRSGREAWQGRPAKVAPAARNPADYDLVILGSPVWAGHVSSPMRGYLKGQAGKFGRVALFVTEGGSGGANALSEMAGLTGSSPVARLELKDSELGSDLEAKLRDFMRRIQPGT